MQTDSLGLTAALARRAAVMAPPYPEPTTTASYPSGLLSLHEFARIESMVFPELRYWTGSSYARNVSLVDLFVIFPVWRFVKVKIFLVTRALFCLCIPFNFYVFIFHPHRRIVYSYFIDKILLMSDFV